MLPLVTLGVSAGQQEFGFEFDNNNNINYHTQFTENNDLVTLYKARLPSNLRHDHPRMRTLTR